ncbi:MAG: TolC family outer membrane protein [Calditrichia bacterium]
MNSKFLVLLVVLAIGIPAFGQQSGKVLSLKDCIRIALDKNYSVETSQNTLELSRLNARRSYSNILPRVNSSFTAGRYQVGEATYLGDVPNPITGEVKQITLTREGFKRNSYSANFSVTQNIFDGGFWWNEIRRTRTLKKAAANDFSSTQNNVIKLVAQYYFDLLKQKKLLEVYSLAVRRSQDQLNRAQQMYEIGSVAQVDVYRARVNLGQDRIAYLNQKNTVRQAQKALNVAMGRDPLTPIVIDSTVNFQLTIPDSTTLLEIATRNQPTLKSRELEVRAKELSVATAKSSFFPTIGASFRYNRDNELMEKIYSDLDKNWSISYGIQISYNLFNGFNDKINYQTSKIELKNSRLALEDYKRNLKTTVTNLYNTYKSILEIVEINKANLEASREEYRLASERYRLGSGTSLELREAQVNLTQAEQVLVSAEYNAIITYIELLEALGTVRDVLN